MISRAEFEAYCVAVDRVVASAQAVTRARIAAWMAAHLDAKTAETRDAAIEILDGGIQVSSNTAAMVAAEWHDERALAEGVNLENAVTSTVYSRAAVDEAVRTMARHLNDGDQAGFLDVCADYAADRARRSVNKTVMDNAYRDKSDGARFARVPTGAETCAFCYMLAMRGAVYWTRRTAGEMGQYHHRCDCKVVPGFKSSRHAELVEGWKPGEAYDRLKLIEGQCGAKAGSDWRANDIVTRSMRLRDRDWLYYGKKVEVDYSMVEGKIPGNPIKLGKYGKDNFRETNGTEWRDAFAYDMLAKNGIKGIARPKAPDDMEGFTSPDLFIQGELWEIKSPDASKANPKPGNELDYIGTALKDSRRNFNNPFDPTTGEAVRDWDGIKRVVLNLKYRPAPASQERIVGKIRGEMLTHKVKEVLYIDQSGELIHLVI